MKQTTTKIKADAKFCENAFSLCSRFGANFFGVLFLAAVIALGFAACESPSLKKVNSSAAEPPENTAAKSGLEDDLQSMRNADFDYIYVFRRKDGGALDGEDKRYLKANSPAVTNRFVLTEENKAAIAGSSFKFEPENLDSLQKRFVVENFSKPENSDSQPENQDAPKKANRQENSNR